MSAPPPVFAHVGLVKTATTTLQRQVFPHHEDIHYLGGPEYCHAAVHEAVKAVSSQDRLRFDLSRHQARVAPVLREGARQAKPILVSAEALSTPDIDRLTKVERLAGIFGDIRLLVCLRRPEDLLISLYCHELKKVNPKTRKVARLEDWLVDFFSQRDAAAPTRLLEFSRLIRGYRELVGEDRVCVLLYEDLVSEPPRFAGQLSDYIGVDAQRTLDLLATTRRNARVTDLQYLSLKLYNVTGYRHTDRLIGAFFPRFLRNVLKQSLSRRRRITMAAEWRERVRSFAREENQDLEELVGPGPRLHQYF